MATKERAKKKKMARGITSGIAHIQASFNNTIITITDKQGNAVKLVIDPATGLVSKEVYRMPAGRGAPADVEEVYSDWREVDGVKLPFKIELYQGGQRTVEVNVEEIKLNTGLTVEELSRQP